MNVRIMDLVRFNPTGAMPARSIVGPYIVKTIVFRF